MGGMGITEMQNPFSVHAMLMGQYQAFVGGGQRTGLATITFTTVSGSPVVPITHTEIVTGFELIPGGQSPKTFIERAEIIASDLNFIPTKGMQVTLKVNGTMTPYAMQIWDGGPEEGGEILRFRLVDSNYSA